MEEKDLNELRKKQIIFLTVDEFMSLQETIGKEGSINYIFPSVMSIDDASRMTGYKKSTLYRKTCKNEIPYYRRGHKLYFRKDEISRWMLCNKETTIEEHAEELDSRLAKKAKSKI